MLGGGTRLFADGEQPPEFDALGDVDGVGVAHLALRPR